MTVTTTPEHTTEPAPVMPPAAEPPKQRSTLLIVGAAVAGLIVLLGAVAAVTYVIISPGANDPESFIPACRDQVKARLKSPSTAKFPGGEAVTESTILGQVDAQNGFGAMIRSQYECTLTKNDKGELHISDVKLG